MKIKLLKNYCGYPAGKIGWLEIYPKHIKHGIHYLVFDSGDKIGIRKIDIEDTCMIITKPPENDAEENHV